MNGGDAAVIPVVTEDPYEMAAISGADAYEFFEEGRTFKAGDWVNKITLKRFQMF